MYNLLPLVEAQLKNSKIKDIRLSMIQVLLPGKKL